MSPRKAAGLLSLLSLLLLSGCLDYDAGTTLSWSPDGGKVAYVAAGKVWVLSMMGQAPEALKGPKNPAALAWSPDGKRLAVAGPAEVATYVESQGVLSSSTSFAVPSVSTGEPTFLLWHPTGQRLLLSRMAGKGATAVEVDLGSGEAASLGSGLAVYGPKGDWLLFMGSAELGKKDRLVFSRQSSEGAELSLPSAAVLEEAATAAASFDVAESPARPFCVASSTAGATTVRCLDGTADLPVLAKLKTEGRVFPDAKGKLFAVVEEPEKQPVRLRILDGKGRLQADGSKFLREALPEAKDGADKSNYRVSRLSWSPDGEWLAWVVEGRLCLWHWRHDLTRVLPLPR